MVATTGLDLHAGHGADVVDGEDVGRVGHRDDELAVLVADRQRVVAAADGVRDARDGRAVDRVVGQVDELHADLRRERGDELALGEHAEVDEDAAEAAAEAALLLDGVGRAARG